MHKESKHGAQVYYAEQTNLAALKDRTVAVVGYGNQGRAHALNLKDSGINVLAAARRDGKAWQQAESDGMPVEPIEKAVARADVIALLLPDEAMPPVMSKAILPVLKEQKEHKTFVFAHGFAISNHTIDLPDKADIVLVAPTGPGRQVRSLYLEGKGLPALIAVDKDSSGQGLATALAYAHAIGCTRAGAILTSFREETVTDLFCEQAVLCGGMPELIKASFQTLIDKGYQPELAYISCLKEVKLIADLLFSQGIDGMRSAISNTAKYGSAIAGPRIINADSERRLAKLLSDIEDGTFARAFVEEAKEGMPVTKAFVKQEANSKLAKMGKKMKETVVF